MIETFVRLIDGRLDSSASSIWQGVLTFQSNITINQVFFQSLSNIILFSWSHLRYKPEAELLLILIPKQIIGDFFSSTINSENTVTQLETNVSLVMAISSNSYLYQKMSRDNGIDPQAELPKFKTRLHLYFWRMMTTTKT